MTTLEKFTEEIQSELKRLLTPLDLQDGAPASLGTAVASVKALLVKLREFISTYRFADALEEVRFFKEIKPVMMSQYLFHKEVFDIRVRCSAMMFEARQQCIERAVRKCHAYSVRHQEFYRYCLSNSSHLDLQYFTRSGQLQTSIDSDPLFTTPNEPTLSRLVANELLIEFLMQWMNGKHERASNAPHLKWTASKTDLTELIYALQASEVFNNGSADIKQIATAFENMTGIQLGDYYRTFQAIQVRKNNQLVFITRLKEKMQSRLDDSI